MKEQKQNMYEFGDSLPLIVNIERVENITYKEGHIKFFMFGGQELSAYYSNMDTYDKEIRMVRKLMNIQIVEELED